MKLHLTFPPNYKDGMQCLKRSTLIASHPLRFNCWTFPMVWAQSNTEPDIWSHQSQNNSSTQSSSQPATTSSWFMSRKLINFGHKTFLSTSRSKISWLIMSSWRWFRFRSRILMSGSHGFLTLKKQWRECLRLMRRGRSRARRASTRVRNSFSHTGSLRLSVISKKWGVSLKKITSWYWEYSNSFKLLAVSILSVTIRAYGSISKWFSVTLRNKEGFHLNNQTQIFQMRKKYHQSRLNLR